MNWFHSSLLLSTPKNFCCLRPICHNLITNENQIAQLKTLDQKLACSIFATTIPCSVKNVKHPVQWKTCKIQGEKNSLMSIESYIESYIIYEAQNFPIKQLVLNIFTRNYEGHDYRGPYESHYYGGRPNLTTGATVHSIHLRLNY